MKRSYEKEMMDLAEACPGEGIYLALRIGQLAASAIAVAIGEANLSSARVAPTVVIFGLSSALSSGSIL